MINTRKTMQSLIAATEEVSDEEVQDVQDAQDTSFDETAEKADVVEENSGIAQATDVIADQVEESVDSGEGLDDKTAAITSVVLEHFYNRAGFVNSHKLSAALEDNSQNGRMVAARYALEDVQDFQIKLAKGLHIAQEGIFSRFGNTIRLWFTSREKITAKLMESMHRIKNSGVKHGDIKEPGWGRSFSKIGKKYLTGADALHIVKEFNVIYTSKQLQDVMAEYVKLIDKITEEVSKGRFLANSEATEEIKKLNDRVDEIRARADKVVAMDVKTAKNDPDFKCLDEKEAKALYDACMHILDDRKMELNVTRLQESINNANVTLFIEGNTRLVGAFASDMRAARQIIFKVNPSLVDILTIIRRVDRLTFACANYLKASAL